MWTFIDCGLFNVFWSWFQLWRAENPHSFALTERTFQTGCIWHLFICYWTLSGSPETLGSPGSVPQFLNLIKNDAHLSRNLLLVRKITTGLNLKHIFLQAQWAAFLVGSHWCLIWWICRFWPPCLLPPPHTHTHKCEWNGVTLSDNNLMNQSECDGQWC